MASFDLNVRLEEDDDNGDAGFDLNMGFDGKTVHSRSPIPSLTFKMREL
jgi:hypothetical protein